MKTKTNVLATFLSTRLLTLPGVVNAGNAPSLAENGSLSASGRNKTHFFV